MGELFALLSAVVWSVAVILFRRSGETVPPFQLNFFRVGVSSVLFAATLPVVGLPLLSGAPPVDYLILVLSGVIAIGISDTCFHMCLNRVGAGINAIVDCLYSPSVVLFAYLLLGERLGSWQFAGMAFVIGGVVVASRTRPPAGATPRTLAVGILWGVVAMLTLGLGIVIAKPVLNRSSIIWAAAIRQFGTLAVMSAAALLSPSRRRIFSVFRPTRAWRFSVPGTVLGSYAALVLWIGSMKLINAGIAAILSQSNTIYILLFASLFLGEPFTRRKLLAAAIAVAGITMVILG